MSPVIAGVLITAGAGLVVRLGVLAVSAYIVRVTGGTGGLRDLATVVCAFSGGPGRRGGGDGNDAA